MEEDQNDMNVDMKSEDMSIDYKNEDDIITTGEVEDLCDEASLDNEDANIDDENGDGTENEEEEDEDEEAEEEEEQEEEEKKINEDALHPVLERRANNLKRNEALLREMFGNCKSERKPERKPRVKRPRNISFCLKPDVMAPRRRSTRLLLKSKGVGECDANDAAQLDTSIEDEDSSSEEYSPPRKRRQYHRSKPPKFVHPDDVTNEDIANISFSSTGKVYNNISGSTCHQCRQKTIDTKTVCRSGTCVGVRGQFCGFCLRNRYGEDAAEALMNEKWSCPVCRGFCNCSICYAKRGKAATGPLVLIAQAIGFRSVKDFIDGIIMIFGDIDILKMKFPNY